MKYDKIWRLDSSIKALDFAYAVKDDHRRNLSVMALEKFQEVVIPQIDHLAKSPIHGDLNELNIIVQETKNADMGFGIIDFGDAHFSCTVFDLAVAMCYMIMECEITTPLDAGGYVLAGFLKHRSLTTLEYSLLKVSNIK